MITTATAVDCIWTCEARNLAPEDAANEFSRSYWQEPRRRRRMDADGRFQMYGEWATYRVVAIPATSPHAALYGIVRE